jgi:hypothetical protein
MKSIATMLAVLLVAVPASAQAPPRELSLEHRMMLRCSAAFALVANRQAAGEASARQYPPLMERGGEYFVRASAKVMDEAGLDRPAITAALQAEAQALTQGTTLAAIMPACLSALDAAGL